MLMLICGLLLSAKSCINRSNKTKSGSSNDTFIINAPLNLTATAVSTSQINLSWIDNSNNEDGFEIERRIGEYSNWIQIATVGSNAVSYSDTELTFGITYYYRVRAFNTIGDRSSWSNEANAGPSEFVGSVVAAGFFHSGVISNRGILWTWGGNQFGQLGLGDSTNRSTPTLLGTEADWQKIVCGNFHTLGLKMDGTLWSWGSGGAGQLGMGDMSNDNWEPFPVPRNGLIDPTIDTDWENIAAGQYHSLAIKNNPDPDEIGGTLWAWGYNELGQLGLGDTEQDRYAPEPVGTDSDWSKIAAGLYHSTALKNDNTIWSWGYNFLGQLGLGGTWVPEGPYWFFEDKFVPTQIGTDSDWFSVTNGVDHTIAIRTNRTIWSWGYNGSGQLGLGNDEVGTAKPSPTQVGIDSDWSAVVAGENCSIALKSNRTLWAWGYNGSYQLGLGDYTARNTPTQIGTDSDWFQIALGVWHTIGLKLNGTVWVWGEGGYQLGLGDINNRTTPTLLQVGSPFAPSYLTIIVRSSSQIGLSWTDNSNNESGFKIERKISGTAYSLLTGVGQNVTSYSDTTVSPGNVYYYRICSYNSFNNSRYSNEVNSIPATPSDLTIKIVSPNQVDISWKDNSIDEIGFTIERKIGLTGTWSTTFTVGANITAYSDITVSPGNDYFYRVRAYNALDNYSACSNEAVPPLPAAPSNLIITVTSSSQIELFWRDNSNDEFGFKIERKISGTDYSLFAAVGQNVISYSDTTVSPGNVYYYKVCAYNALDKNGSYSNEINSYPSIPSSLIITVTSSSQIDLYWNDNSRDEIGFKIGRKINDGEWDNEFSASNANTPSYSDTMVSPGNVYYYKVCAYNALDNHSDFSSPVNSIPQAPSNLTLSIPSNLQFDLSWQDNSHDELGFKIERKIGDEGSYEQIGITNTNITYYHDISQTGFTPDTNYYYRIRAYNSLDNDSEYSNETSSKIRAPSNLVCRLISDTQIDLSWNDISLIEDGFKIERKLGASGFYEEIATVNVNTISYSDTTVSQSLIPYYYRVCAYYFYGNAYSNEAWISTLGEWSAVAAGEIHSIGIKTNRTIWAWGNNQQGQLGLGNSGSWTERKAPTQIITGSDSDWIAIAASGYHTLAVKENNNLWAWGYNVYGQLGIGDTNDRNTPTQIGSDSDWCAVSGTNLSTIAAGDNHTIAIKINGTLWTWGRNNNGQLGLGDYTDRITPTQITTNTDWSIIAAGAEHTLAIKTSPAVSGTIWAWGCNNQGQLGLGFGGGTRITPSQIGTDSGWFAIACGSYHSMALKQNLVGGIERWVWGLNDFGQLGNGNTNTQISPVNMMPLDGGTPWTTIEGGYNHSIGIRNGIAWGWGRNDYGQLGLVGSEKTQPTQIGIDTAWSRQGGIVGGGYHTLAIKDNGTLWAWGRNNNSQLGLGDADNRNYPVQTGFPVPNQPTGLTTTLISPIQISLLWMDNSSDELGFKIERKSGIADWIEINRVNADITSYSDTGLSSNIHSYRVRAYNIYRDSIYSNDIIVDSRTPSNFTATVISSTQITLSWIDNSLDENGFKIERKIRDSGTYEEIATVGSSINYYYDISSTGFAFTTYYYRVRAFFPFNNSGYSNEISITPPGDWATVIAGYSYTLAIKTNNTIWSWGENDCGQLGLGDYTTRRKTPTQIQSDTDWLAVRAGFWHTIALKTNRTMWSWGWNGEGELGLGDANDRLTPSQIGCTSDWLPQGVSGTNLSTIAVGDMYNIARKTEGTIWSWGYNVEGQLGVGDYTNRNTPSLIGTSSDWSIIAAGGNGYAGHTIAIKTNGTVWSWGYNTYGQLGLGDTISRNTPSQIIIGTDNDWSIVVAGELHTIARQNNGTLWAWGSNGSGQLGLEDSSNRNTPSQIGTNSDWSIMAGGTNHTLAIKTNGTLWAWGKNDYWQLGLGDVNTRLTPTQIGINSDWIAVTAGKYYRTHSLAIKNNGTLWAWGYNDCGQLGIGNTINRNVPTLIGE
jgi:alpha-tubulin suppressor-like RCC1 family protein